jgi:ABC-2 type transport system permease protein
MGNIFYFLSTENHFESISRGVIDTRDIIYFLSVTALGILGSSYFIVKKYA